VKAALILLSHVTFPFNRLFTRNTNFMSRDIVRHCANETVSKIRLPSIRRSLIGRPNV
jgi:hypothetical protein